MFRFLTYEGQELTPQDGELYEVGLTKWITVLDENMIGKIKWPPCDAGTFVRKERSACPDWEEECIIVRRFYDTYINAVNSCKGVMEDSNYETDREFGRGKRKKKKINHFDSESEKESDNKIKFDAKSKRMKKEANVFKHTKKIVPPPPVPFSKMLSPEKITRQYIKLEKPPVLNILVSEPSKKSHVNVLKNIKRKSQEEMDKRAQLLEKLKKCRHEKQHSTQQMSYSSFSTQNTMQEQKMHEVYTRNRRILLKSNW